MLATKGKQQLQQRALLAAAHAIVSETMRMIIDASEKINKSSKVSDVQKLLNMVIPPLTAIAEGKEK